jgi:hypothetical protein
MLGRRYRLAKPLLAVHADGRRGFLLVPEGAVLLVSAEDEGSRVLRITWRKKQFFAFAQDVFERGSESNCSFPS